MLHGYVCYTSKCKIFFKLKFSLPFFFLLKELIVKAVIYGCFTWSKRIWVHPEWWLLFTLAFIWPSFCNSNTSISVFTVSGLSFRLELVDIVNHCWIEKNLRLLLFFILYAEEFIVTEMMLWSQTKKKNSAILTCWSKWWTYYKFERYLWNRKRVFLLLALQSWQHIKISSK